MLIASANDIPTVIREDARQAKRMGRTERLALVTLLVFYLLSACGFALATPYGEAPDEHGHLLYIEHLVRFGTLPEIKIQPYSYDAFHPPLYYVLGAGLVSAGRVVTGKSLDKPLAPTVRYNSKRDQAPVALPQVFLHPPEERWPLTVYALRGISILMGLGMIVLTYATARALVPKPASPVVPLVSAAFAALIPQANFIRASITNENASALVGALIIWLLALHLTKPYSARRVFWIGLALGLGLLSKLSVAPLSLPVLWVLWVRRERKPSRFLLDMVRVAGMVLLVAGWLYAYKWVVYGDPIAYRAWQELVPPDGVYSLGDLFWFQEPFRAMLWTSFWGVYGWQQIFMPDWIYLAFIGVTLAAVVGGAILLIRRAFSAAQQAICAVLLFTLLLLYTFVVQASTYVVAWQGREMFPALSSVCILLGLGLGALALGRGATQPIQLSGQRHAVGWGLFALVTVGLFALNLYSIFWLVMPALNS